MTSSSALAVAEDAAPAPSALPAHLPYRRDIDGLRAVAVLAVVLFHAFPARLRGGFVGVDIFFIISGFLIGSILISGLQRGTFSFADFYARRVRRIFPALTLVLACTLAFGWFALFPDEYKLLGKHVFGGAGFVSNFFLWNEVGYFDTAAETKPLLHLWSLGIEEQFYIFWPIVLLLAWKRRWNLLLVAVLLGGLSFAVNIGGVARFPSATFYSPASRVWELLMGAALAYASVNGLRFYAGVRRPGGATQIDFDSPRWRNLMSVLGLLLICVALVAIKRDRLFPGWWALLPTLGAFLLIAAGPQGWVNRYLLSNRLMVGVGLVSYPLYLWHWPLLSFAQIVESGLPSRNVRLGAVAAALLLAVLTYFLVEKPLRGTRHGRRKVLLLSLLMVVLAGIGGAIYRADGLPLRRAVVENALQQKDLILVEDKANAAACKARYGFASLYEYCLMDEVSKDPTVLLIGDSHGYHLVAGMTRYWRGKGENVWYLGTRVPFVGLPVGDDPYQQATPMMMDLALGTASVKTVIISTAAKLGDDPAGLQRTEALRDTFARLLKAGKQVIWINDLPMLDFEPRACIRRGAVAASTTRRDCAMDAATYRKNVARHDELVAQVLAAFPAVRVFDAAAQLCDAQRCKVKDGDILLYRDTHHLSYRGDLWMGERFGRFMDAR